MTNKTRKNERKHKLNKKINRKSNKNNRRIGNKKTYRAGGIFDISAQALQTNATIRTLESMASPGTIKKITNSKTNPKKVSDYKIVKVKEKNGEIKYYRVKVKRNEQSGHSVMPILSRVITAVN